MPFIYTQADLTSAINRGIQNRQGLLISMQDLANEAVRDVKNEVRIRSSKRSQALVPNLLNGPSQYVSFADFDGSGLIDIPAQAKRYDGEFNLTTAEEFARGPLPGDVAVDNYNGIQVMLINSITPDQSVTIDPLSTLAVTGGTWAAFGDATTVAAEVDDFVSGQGSISFSINAAGGTTAGIVLNGTRALDLSTYIGKNTVFPVFARITSATGITNYKLRLGTSASAYYEFTVTVRQDGTAFIAGWNPLSFSGLTYATTGSPNAASIKYAAIFMTKAITKITESGYMFNYLQARNGKYANVKYYSKYGWQTSAGAYIENSTSSSDILVADTDEFDLFIKKGRVLAAYEADIPVGLSRSGKIIDPRQMAYDAAVKNYEMTSPSEEKLVITSYHDYGYRGDRHDNKN